MKERLSHLSHIDRVSFRAKTTQSFVKKVFPPDEPRRYEFPFAEVEDQIGGRVLTFFGQDIPRVLAELQNRFKPVEATHKAPKGVSEFDYETDHLICVIPPDLLPARWQDFEDMPTTFEMQVRTLFMHAWAEPQHDLLYKGRSELPIQIRRELHWAAASAWGADHALSRVLEWVQKQQEREREANDDSSSP